MDIKTGIPMPVFDEDEELGEIPEVDVEVLPEGEGIIEEQLALLIEDDGSVSVLDDINMLEQEAVPFNANLAEVLEEDELETLSTELHALYTVDKESRKEWEKTYKDGLELLGLKIEERDEPWQGAFGAHHPVLAEAVVKFQSETVVETFPAAGPVKCKIVGEQIPEKEVSAARVKEDMNYLLTETMSEYRSEHERMLFSLPLAGTAIKKMWYDEEAQAPVSLFIPADDFIVSYGATDLKSAQRYTHRLKVSKNDLRKMQVSGFYRQCELEEPEGMESSEINEIEKARNEYTGLDEEKDDRHTLLEMHCNINLPGFEDLDVDGEGQPYETGIELPYVVTIDSTSRKILAIYRNWEEDDPGRNKRIHFSHYTYVPGFGFYGFGLIHLIGGFAKGATSILRQLVDSGTLANLPGGYKTRGLRIKGGDDPIAPGEFRDADVPVGTLKDNLMPLPYKEPSATLFGLLENVVNEARRFAAITDINVADMQPNAPVGSTLAVLERTLKTMTAIQARVHDAMKDEFKILKKLVVDFGNPSYVYDAFGQDAPSIRLQDYSIVEVIPVSDPNASTMSQRIVQHQAALQLAQTNPEIYDVPYLHREMLRALGMKDVEKLVPDKTQVPAMDPIAENMAVLMGEPVKAYMHQDHEAHIAAHMSFGQDPKIQQMLEMQGPAAQQKMAAGMAHINEHLGFLYRKQIEEQLGAPLPPPDQPLPPDVEVQLSKLVGDAAQRLLGKHQQEAAIEQAQQQEQDPLTQIQRGELEVKQGELERKRDKDKMDHDEAMRRLEIERERIQSQEDQTNTSVAGRVAQTVIEKDADLQGVGAKIGAEARKMEQSDLQKGFDAGVQLSLDERNAQREAEREQRAAQQPKPEDSNK